MTLRLVVPGSEGLPAQAVVELQAAIGFPAVLRVDAGEVVAIVDELIVALAEAGHEAHEEVAVGVGIGVGGAADLVGDAVEAEGAVRGVDVGDVDLGELDVTAEGEVVIALDPVEVVVEGVVVAAPCGVGGGCGAEVAGDGGLQERAGVGLPDVGDAVVGDLGAARRTAAESDFALVVDDEGVQKAGR